MKNSGVIKFKQQDFGILPAFLGRGGCWTSEWNYRRRNPTTLIFCQRIRCQYFFLIHVTKQSGCIQRSALKGVHLGPNPKASKLSTAVLLSVVTE